MTVSLFKLVVDEVNTAENLQKVATEYWKPLEGLNMDESLRRKKIARTCKGQWNLL